MTTDGEATYDVLVVGSGAAGMTAAMTAIDEGLSVLILESTAKWGGSSAMSGGGLWLPTNPLMRRDRVADSREEALAYMEATIGDVGTATSRARKEAFVDSVGDYVRTAEAYGVRFARATDYPDYYPELDGGKIGRSIEVQPLDGKVLGAHFDTLRMTMPVPIMTNDVWLLSRAWSTFGGMVRGAQVVLRILGGLLRGQKKLGIGAGLMASLGKAVLVDHGTPMWLSAPVTALLTEDGRVTGVEVDRGGQSLRVRARHGVVLASGGFDHNVDWRQKYQGVDGYPSGNPGNLGGGIAVARDAGAALELMDEAWWGASIAPVPGGDPAFIVGERSLPHSIIVDADGRRFANESESYVDLGHHMLAHGVERPYWFILDRRHVLKYLRTFALDPRLGRAMTEQGLRVEADTLAELAGRLGLDESVFREQVARFNGFARSGRDQDFHRGDSAYDRYYGDPNVRPNPCLGTIEKGPFLAYRVVVGDLGTKGGVVTDADARALREDGSVIDGLYAAGNASASVMGRTYPGPGSTIGPASVFALRAVRHLAAART